MITVSSSFNFIFKFGDTIHDLDRYSFDSWYKINREKWGGCRGRKWCPFGWVDFSNKCNCWTWSINWNSTTSVWDSASVRKQSKILALCELLGMVWLFCYCYLMLSFSGHASFYFSLEELFSYRGMNSNKRKLAGFQRAKGIQINYICFQCPFDCVFDALGNSCIKSSLSFIAVEKKKLL